MPHCPHCSAEVPAGARFCPGCGAAQSSVSQMPTALAPGGQGGAPAGASRAAPAPIGRLETQGSLAGAAFQPGQLLAGRFRVVGLLGRGGMGEVYRADDLELSQPVSLKFLGRALSDRPDMLERFRAEVRNARQVAHPNVCRMYDIGEAQGRYFLSMEFVDGEDLGSLLKRIGRLPRAKADEVAIQLCAGLAAAHDRGVIHRDLKPSNVMIDGEGRVRITDFGLAVSASEGEPGVVAGTPAYMAPEQFEGQAATVQSDLYALGLILYEIYTGRRPLEAATWDGWKSQHSQVEPKSPEVVERDVPEPVARAILRCLEKDSTQRPRSARALAASLPGGDPLGMALAAGETPSPQMVAASGGEGSLPVRRAWLYMGAFLAFSVAIFALAPAAYDLGLAPLTTGREGLETRARDMVVGLGYHQPPRDAAAWFERDYQAMLWRARREPSTQWRRDHARAGPPLLLVYRQSPRAMTPKGAGEVRAEDPPLTISGMVSLSLDGMGRLRRMEAVPPQVDSANLARVVLRAVLPDSLARPGFGRAAPLFALAGLDTAAFREVEPVWVPLPAFDSRREWVGTAERLPGVPLRVSAAWWGERPVSFAVRGPWERPTRMGPREAALSGFNTTIATILAGAMVVLGAVTARRRLRSGRSDWRGGVRLTGFVVACRVLSWAVGAHHTLDPGAEFGNFALHLGLGLAEGSFLFAVYLAVEPYVRRHTPELLVGWARVLQGRIADPRVGRDTLVGACVAVLTVLVLMVVNALPTWIPFTGQTTVPPVMAALAGGRVLLGDYLGAPNDVLMPAFTLFGGWFLLRILLRRPLLAAIGLAVVLTLIALGAENPVLETPGALVSGVLMAWLITRHGLLALVAMWFMRFLLVRILLPFTPTSPYAFQSIVGILLVLVVTAWAFRVSLGGRPAFTLATDE